MLAHLLDQLAAIGAIDPEQPQLFTGAAEPRKEQAGPRGVGHGGCRDQHGHQEPQRIDEEMPFAPFDVFAFVVAAFPSQFRGLDALAIKAAGRGMFVAPSLLAHLGTQRVVKPLPVPTIAPLVEIPVHTGPLGILMGEHPPFDAPIDDIKKRIDDRPHIQLAGAPTRFGWRDQLFDQIPFGISEVCRVWCCSHSHSVPN